MAARGRPRKTKAADATAEIKTRDPQPQRRLPRRYIPANMPTVCPTCQHNTRMDDGRHVDPVRQTVLEYRTCVKCGEKLAAGRPMTETEKAKLCGRAEAVAEYEDAIRRR